MDDLEEIYERITYLRKRGVKMKDMAEQASISSSVLSAVYSTVLPSYVKNLEKGKMPDEALQEALSWVNNVSKKKLLGSITDLKTSLFAMEATTVMQTDRATNPFLESLAGNMASAVSHIAGYAGIYISYSVSSGNPEVMKIEPYFIAPSANGAYVEVGHNNAYGSTHWGAAMMNGLNHLYLMFNEYTGAQLALFHICLKLPLYDRPPFLKGVYTCLDYNSNPVARRILLVKHSDCADREAFMTLKGELKTYDSLNDEEKRYFDYTCGAEDIVRMCNIPSPQMTDADLAVEKKILAM